DVVGEPRRGAGGQVAWTECVALAAKMLAKPLFVPVDGDHAGAEGMQLLGDSAADPVRGARDHRGPPREPVHHGRPAAAARPSLRAAATARSAGTRVARRRQARTT